MAPSSSGVVVASLPSVFEILKPAVGPSSSHTLGPMAAAQAFARLAADRGKPGDRIRVELYGSLAFTGRGHLTDLAVAAGLAGYGPRELAGTSLEEVARGVREAGRVRVEGRDVLFDLDQDVVFDATAKNLPHPNTMRFSLVASDGSGVLSETYASVGGGRVAGGTFGELDASRAEGGTISMSRVLAECERAKIDLAEYAYRHEEADHAHTRSAVDAHLGEMWGMMRESVERGLAAEGTLPGTLRLERRAQGLYARFQKALPHFHVLSPEASLASIYAIAAAEENAAGGAVVTAPTCGSCGVVPACLRVVQEKMACSDDEILRALLVASLIGAMIATNASISGAEVGCQGEIGAASAMAAGAVCALLGGNPRDQVDRAAESALEHYLGLTCDPVDGLVQIPCIERNAAGAVSALNAAGLAMMSAGGDRVSFDAVVDAMRRTGLDLDARYKETARGGLAAATDLGG
ncbi:MAG: L-serine ammonia-lyase [Candidatus Bipolaricaulis sp.]|nr:L-serine ammonia-lyase [Candidatus Bipolaricaulis sp.]